MGEEIFGALQFVVPGSDGTGIHDVAPVLPRGTRSGGGGQDTEIEVSFPLCMSARIALTTANE